MRLRVLLLTVVLMALTATPALGHRTFRQVGVDGLVDTRCDSPHPYRVTLYEHEDFQGTWLRLCGPVHDLREASLCSFFTCWNFNDQVSSVFVNKRPLCTFHWRLWEHIDYSGAKAFSPSHARYLSMTGWNDRASSVDFVSCS